MILKKKTNLIIFQKINKMGKKKKGKKKGIAATLFLLKKNSCWVINIVPFSLA